MVRQRDKAKSAQEVLDQGVASLGWRGLKEPLLHGMTVENILAIMRDSYIRTPDPKLLAWSRQCRTFMCEIAPGDLVVHPLSALKDPSKGRLLIGRATAYVAPRTAEGEHEHLLPVNWHPNPICKTIFAEDLRYTLGSVLTIFRLERNDACRRLRTMHESGFTIPDPGPFALP